MGGNPASGTLKLYVISATDEVELSEITAELGKVELLDGSKPMKDSFHDVPFARAWKLQIVVEISDSNKRE